MNLKNFSKSHLQEKKLKKIKRQICWTEVKIGWLRFVSGRSVSEPLMYFVIVAAFCHGLRNFLERFFAPIIFVIVLILNACSADGLNQISTKKVKNEITGEIKEYKSIKISEDEQNNYVLNVEIPQDHKQVSWNRLSKDNALISEFLPKNSSEKKYISNFRISIELYPKKSLHDYLVWRRDYIDEVYKTYRSQIIYDFSEEDNYDFPDSFPESATIIQEMPCLPRLEIVCLPNQKEINIIKAFQGKNTFWTIEYSKVIDGRLSESEKDEVIKNSELLINRCCKIEIVKKPINQEQ